VSLTSDQAVARFDSVHPLLSEARQSLIAEWKDQSPPLSLVMSKYSSAVCSHLAVFSTAELKDIFETTEHLLRFGDDHVKDGVATCFLEGLLGRASAGTLDFRQISSYLGGESRAYCRAWDKFTGVATPGLEDGGAP
jgi:hypothetical protein